MRYQVFDCDKPCDCEHHQVHKSWNNSIFDTFEESVEYAKKWFEPYYTEIKEPNVKYDYYGNDKSFTSEIKTI